MKGTRGATNIRILALGALAGLAAAAFGILERDVSQQPVPDSAIARVNGNLIDRDYYDRVAAQSDFGPQVADDQVLARLIDNELLIQRGVELGMAHTDDAVRQAIINSLIASVTAEADAASPTDQQLEQYLSGNPERFRYVSAISISAWQTEDERSAQSFAEDLRTVGNAAELAEDIQPLPDLPSGLMSLDIAGNYVGPGIAAAAAQMPVGSSSVFARRGRWLILQVADKKESTVTDISTIRNRVLIDYRRDLAEQALEAYLENLRQQADITVAAP